MGPSIVAVQRAAQLFADPAVRAQVLAWHAEGVGLYEMVERLGFADLVDPTLRATIEGLEPSEVAVIRDAFVAEIERAGSATTATMPVECSITEVSGPVMVTAVDVGGLPVARVEPASGQ